MTSFPTAIRSVFRGGGVPEISKIHNFPVAWPIFRFVAPPPVEIPVAELARVVEREIIPRLYLAHAQIFPTPPEQDPLESAKGFLKTILSGNLDALAAIIDAMHAKCISDGIIYAEWLAPAARLLVDLWQDDEVSYTEVTLGLGRLQQLVRGLAESTPYNGESDPMSRSALFAPSPGEQQTFGFFMMEESFRWSGWRTWIETCVSTAEIIDDVRSRWLDMLCLSVTRSDNLEEIDAMIKSVRRASRNRDIFVLVNGRSSAERGESGAGIGADAFASNGAEALHLMDKALRSVAAE
jgi:methanogenic corrinoid protein MtbC1